MAMIDTDTQAWRENVAVALADIRAQLLRLAADRESEKGTLLRATEQLQAEDCRHMDRLERHVEWNDTEHEKLRNKVNIVTGRVNFFAGVILTLQFVIPIVVGVAVALFTK